MKTKYTVILALLVVSSMASAIGGKTFTWVPPVQRVDSSFLPQQEIAAYNLYCDGITTPLQVVPNVPLDTNTWTAPDGTFSVGAHSCHVTAVDTAGRESAKSNTVNFSIVLARPNPPANLQHSTP